MKTVKVKYLKSHPKDAYFPGDIAEISSEKAAERVAKGFVMLLPDDEKKGKENPLPEDFPSRDILFKEKFETVEQVKEAGEALLDIKGIGKGTLKQIEEWFEKQK